MKCVSLVGGCMGGCSFWIKMLTPEEASLLPQQQQQQQQQQQK